MTPENLQAEKQPLTFPVWLTALKECRRCSLCETRTQAVAGEYRKDPLIFMLGEAPGGREDQEGRPFCGQAGGILDDFLRLADLKREEVYISNVVKCRPTRPSNKGIYGNYANRKPTLDEIRTCSPWLELELQLLRDAHNGCWGPNSGPPATAVLEVETSSFFGKSVMSNNALLGHTGKMSC